MTITPERPANPQKLLKLAKVMGLRRPFITELDDYDQCLYCTEDDYIIFRPHIDEAQAMRVQEWMLTKSKAISSVHKTEGKFGVLLFNSETMLERPQDPTTSCWIQTEFVETLPEAITLAALELIDGTK